MKIQPVLIHGSGISIMESTLTIISGILQKQKPLMKDLAEILHVLMLLQVREPVQFIQTYFLPKLK